MVASLYSPTETTVSDRLPFYQPSGREVQLFEQAWHLQIPLLLKGPTGCGKTRFVEHMAAKLGRPLYTVACHDDLSAADLVGRHLIGDGDTYWSDGPLTRSVREGAICYLDEVVEARKDTTVVIHPLSDDRRILPLERTGEILRAPQEFMLVMSYNPGYQNLLKGMKPSTRQRFVSVTFEYPDADLETRIVVEETGIDPSMAALLVQLATALRALKDHDLEESASTRLLVYAAQLIKRGYPVVEACRAAVIEPLSDEQDTIEALMHVVRAVIPEAD